MENRLKTAIVLLTLVCGASCVGMLVGGWKAGKREAVEPFLSQITGAFSEKSNSGSNVHIAPGTDDDGVWDIQAQLVNGMNYKFAVRFGHNLCVQRSPNDMDAVCEEVKTECRVSVWRGFDGKVELNYLKCDGDVAKRSVDSIGRERLGNAGEADTEDAGIVDAANFAVDEINRRSNSLYRSMLLDISHANKQTVAGFKYKMLLVTGVSKCRNTAEHMGVSLEDCPLSSDERKQCTVVVHDQSWLQSRFTLLDFSCTTAQKAASDNDVLKSPGKPNLGGDDTDVGNHGQFLMFLKKYNKTYENDAEHIRRFNIFRENMATAKKLQKQDTGDARYGPSPFADLSADEFRKNYLNPRWNVNFDSYLKQAEIPLGSAPDAFDWRNHSAVTEVKNQGSCGSCWAFSTTGNIEGQWAIKKSQLLSLSEQELVDCDKVDQGCDGGLPTNAYKEIERLGGLETEKDYPYEAEDEKCTFQKKEAKVQINGAVNISSDEGDMAAWLAQNGPISIGINAMAMQFYMGGVSHPWSFFCSPDDLDHGVLIVGYGIKKGIFSNTPYWIVKNSWGASWGEQGYYLVYRGGGVCGLNKMPTSAVVN